ncbi:MAG: VOC family protein [Gemmatimonadota bacterium]
MIKAIKFVSIPTRDQDRALEFYTTKLGFIISTDQPFDEKQRWIELRIPGADTQFVLFTPDGWEERIGSFFNFAFTTDDIDGTYAEFQAKGVETLGPPEKAGWGSSIKFKDSEGNQLLVSSR